MARLNYVCDSLCVYFILLHGISLVFSINDYYFYNTDLSLSPHHRSEYSLKLEENEDLHQFQKRNAEEQFTISDNRSNPSSNVTEIPLKLKPGKISKPTNLTKIIQQQQQQQQEQQQQQQQQQKEIVTLTKNLGVNGTGQRKLISTTIKPLLLTTNTTTINTDNNVNNTSILTTDHHDVDNIGSDENEDHDFQLTKVVDLPNDNINNKTLSEHNITKSSTDTHLYYNSTLNTDPEQAHNYWIDLSNRTDVKTNELLSRSHRRAATVKLSFDFPFYGHLIKNVTIATGGFLYTGDYVHSWLAATQYIAPLMANFDTSISNDSYIKYVDNGTAFTVEWDRVSLQDKPNEGEFTFQVTLHKNGDIVFVYQNIPLLIERIEDDHHPVKVGLSDAYIIDRTIFFVRRKTIYEYHRVNFDKNDIKNWTVIYLTALPTCLDSKTCTACLTREIPNFKCKWCPTTNKCSNGLDRDRHHWLILNCDKKQIGNESLCSHVPTQDIFEKDDKSYIHDLKKFEEANNAKLSSRVYNDNNDRTNLINTNNNSQPMKMGVSGIVAILFLISMMTCLAVWILYAYRNPHTTSGQILIRYRPSQWRWRRGEARYTAATIHM